MTVQTLKDTALGWPRLIANIVRRPCASANAVNSKIANWVSERYASM